MGSANERRRYTVTSSLIGRAHTQNDPRLLFTPTKMRYNEKLTWAVPTEQKQHNWTSCETCRRFLIGFDLFCVIRHQGINLPIFFRVVPLALGQSFDCPVLLWSFPEGYWWDRPMANHTHTHKTHAHTHTHTHTQGNYEVNVRCMTKPVRNDTVYLQFLLYWTVL